MILEKYVIELQESLRSSITISTPSAIFLKKCHTILGGQEGISLVKAIGACSQDSRRKINNSSLRNLAVQIGTTICKSFVK